MAEAILGEVVELAYDYRTIKNGGDVLDEEEKYYVALGDAGDKIRNWENYARMIKHSFRFHFPDEFNPLPELLGTLGGYETASGEGILRELQPGDKIFRGRKIHSDSDIIRASQEPDKVFGPPPEGKSTAGRMNPLGVPFLYCAMSRETCVAENRAPVGSLVATAQIEILRPLTVIDLTILEDDLVSSVGFFHPNYPDEISQLNFLRQFHQRISQPIFTDMDLEYLPTQAVAEYFAHRFKPQVDGLIYSSCQGTAIGNNLVLFNHASGIEELPRATQSEVRYGVSLYDEYCILYNLEDEKNEARSEEEENRLQMLERIKKEFFQPSVRVIMDSVRLHKISSICHTYSTLEIDDEPIQISTPPDLDLDELIL
ncbi:MAG: RES family NAD+ phosphorylase [Candidatus Aegiribacteria sp.]|nr:RES family NAD+ phosphorylase [Candidatus Aegiribacteria sp.]